LLSQLVEKEIKVARSSVKQITVNQNVRSRRIYPVEDTINTSCPAKHSKNWKGDTVAFSLNKEQAIHLARVLLAATQEWDEIAVVAWRRDKRKSDGTYPVTVSSVVDSPKD
jgi:hypothetical protein